MQRVDHIDPVPQYNQGKSELLKSQKSNAISKHGRPNPQKPHSRVSRDQIGDVNVVILREHEEKIIVPK
jgi:hypothetical protein